MAVNIWAHNVYVIVAAKAKAAKKAVKKTVKRRTKSAQTFWRKHFPAVKAFLVRWGKMFAPALLGAAGAVVLLLLFWWSFPETFAHYRANGGPVLQAIIAAAIAGIVLKHIGKGVVQKSFLIVVCLIIAIAMLRGFFANPSEPAHESIATANPVPTPAASKNCPGVAPTAPLRIGKEWERINPAGCDLTFAVVEGSVVLKGTNGEETISSSDKTVGFRNYSINTDVKAAGDSASFFYMLCPRGKGPHDGGWECQPSSGGGEHIGVEAKLGIGLGVYAK